MTFTSLSRGLTPTPPLPVEANPVVTRKCGFAQNITEDACTMSNNGYVNMLRCLCKTGLCNGSDKVAGSGVGVALVAIFSAMAARRL